MLVKHPENNGHDQSMAVTRWQIEEAARSGTEIANMMRADERLLAVGVSIIAAISTVVIDSERSDVLLFLPFSLTALITFSNYQRANMMALGGYKKALEESITSSLGTPVILWESSVAPKMHNNIPTIALRGILLVIYVGSIVIANDAANDTNGEVIWAVVVNILGFIAASLSWYFSLSRFTSVYELTTSELKLGASSLSRSPASAEIAASTPDPDQWPPPRST